MNRRRHCAVDFEAPSKKAQQGKASKPTPAQQQQKKRHVAVGKLPFFAVCAAEVASSKSNKRSKPGDETALWAVLVVSSATRHADTHTMLKVRLSVLYNR